MTSSRAVSSGLARALLESGIQSCRAVHVSAGLVEARSHLDATQLDSRVERLASGPSDSRPTLKWRGANGAPTMERGTVADELRPDAAAHARGRKEVRV